MYTPFRALGTPNRDGSWCWTHPAATVGNVGYKKPQRLAVLDTLNRDGWRMGRWTRTRNRVLSRRKTSTSLAAGAAPPLRFPFQTRSILFLNYESTKIVGLSNRYSRMLELPFYMCGCQNLYRLDTVRCQVALQFSQFSQRNVTKLTNLLHKCALVKASRVEIGC